MTFRPKNDLKGRIHAGIATIPDMETLRECVAYENANQNRTQILRRLEWKAAELIEEGRHTPIDFVANLAYPVQILSISIVERPVTDIDAVEYTGRRNP